MASVCSIGVLPAAKTVSAPRVAAPLIPLTKVSNQWKSRTVSNGMKTTAFKIWQPVNNKYFETLSYLPPLSDDAIAKQVDYITRNGWIPCLEFAPSERESYIASDNCIRFGPVSSNYLDNRYWTMFKLPMFGCTDAGQVLKEIRECEKLFPEAYIRIIGFDSVRQVQVAGFLVHRPKTAKEFRAPEDRSVGAS